MVIPCYRTDLSIIPYLHEANDFFSDHRINFEVICVVDGPNSVEPRVLEQLKNLTFVTTIILSKNFGQHAALLAGIQAAKSEWVITVDDDGQHPISQLPKLLENLEGYDVNYGISINSPNNFIKTTFSIVNRKILKKLMGTNHEFSISAFRVFKKNLILSTNKNQYADYLLDVEIIWATSRVKNTEVTFAIRTKDKSNYTFRSMLKLALPLWLGFSRTPLRFFTLLGLTTLLINTVLFIFFSINKFQGDLGNQGFYSLISLLLVSSSVILIGLSILGEYLVHVYESTRKKPIYRIIEE